jgi:UDP-3-O-[3-hydroxymyristoyl] glucosamine N-acyltransferase
MKLTVNEIAGIIGGKVEGDGNVAISKLAKIEQGDLEAISFLANPKYASHLYTTKSSAVIIAHDYVLERAVNTTLIRVEDPYSAFTSLLEMAQSVRNMRTEIEPQTFIHETSTLSDGLFLGAFSYIGAYAKIGVNVKIHQQVFVGEFVEIGDGTIIYPGVQIQPGCKIGANCIIHSGVVIGSDGFGFAPQKDGTFKKIPQTGIVVIEDDVEIGANTCIDRATLGETIIRKGAKLDNLVQIAHNVEIGQNTAIASQAGVSGSTKIGRNCMIGGQVGFVGHLNIADKTQVGGQSGVSKSVTETGKNLRGSPALSYREQLKNEAYIKQLGTLFEQIKELEKKIAILESR